MRRRGRQRASASCAWRSGPCAPPERRGCTWHNGGHGCVVSGSDRGARHVCGERGAVADGALLGVARGRLGRPRLLRLRRRRHRPERGCPRHRHDRPDDPGSEPVEIGFRVCVAAIFAVWWLYAVIQSYRRARVAARLVNMPGETFGEYLLGTAGTVVIAWTLITIVVGMNRLGRMLVAMLDGYMPRPAAILVGVAILVVIVFFLTSNVILRGGIGFVRHHARADEPRAPRVASTKPFVPERSASPASPVTWESVGGQGRVFLGRGPRASTSRRCAAARPWNPSASTPACPRVGWVSSRQRRRWSPSCAAPGAFDRAVILIAASTGSGWSTSGRSSPSSS